MIDNIFTVYDANKVKEQIVDYFIELLSTNLNLTEYSYVEFEIIKSYQGYQKKETKTFASGKINGGLQKDSNPISITLMDPKFYKIIINITKYIPPYATSFSAKFEELRKYILNFAKSISTNQNTIESNLKESMNKKVSLKDKGRDILKDFDQLMIRIVDDHVSRIIYKTSTEGLAPTICYTKDLKDNLSHAVNVHVIKVLTDFVINEYDINLYFSKYGYPLNEYDYPLNKDKFLAFFDKKFSELHTSTIDLATYHEDTEYVTRDFYRFRDAIRDYIKSSGKND